MQIGVSAGVWTNRVLMGKAGRVVAEELTSPCVIGTRSRRAQRVALTLHVAILESPVPGTLD